ncbi:MAG: RNA 2',3'-cyclic phosphodiesterase [Candidatus Nanohaloarchaea archaeon]
MARAFTAIDIPDEVAQRLSRIQEEIGVGKPVRPEKMHVTLEFFQDLSREEIDQTVESLEGLEFRPFKAKVKGLGVFPSKRFIRVLWAGVDSREVEKLYKRSCSVTPESDNDHDFRPHITLSRVKDLKRGEKKRVHEALQKYSGKGFGSFKVDKLRFYRSRLQENGSEYTELYVKDLG